MNQLIIRADAFPAIGVGHLMRSIAIAEAWQMHDDGGVATIVSYCESDDLWNQVKSRFKGIHWRLKALHNDEMIWAKSLTFDGAWVVLDGYHFTRDYEEKIAACGHPILRVDDNAITERQPYYADLILNYNAHASRDMYSRTLLDSTVPTKLLLGPKFALIRNVFRRARKVKTPRISDTQQRDKVLLAWGGAMTEEMKEKATAIHYDLEDICWVQTPADFDGDMAQAMLWADIYVGSAGVTPYEAAYMGLPSVLLVTADNQLGSAQALGNRGVGHYMGPIMDAARTDIRAIVYTLSVDMNLYIQMSERATKMVDGRGAKRVVEVLKYVEKDRDTDLGYSGSAAAGMYSGGADGPPAGSACAF